MASLKDISESSIAATKAEIASYEEAAAQPNSIQNATEALQQCHSANETAEAELQLCRLYIGSGTAEHLDAAQVLLAKFMESGSHRSTCLFLQALLYYKQGRFRDARLTISTLAEKEPQNHLAEGFLGMLVQTYENEGPKGLMYAGIAAVVIVAIVGIAWYCAQPSKSEMQSFKPTKPQISENFRIVKKP